MLEIIHRIMLMMRVKWVKQIIFQRDTQYATGEIKRWYFEAVFEVPTEKMGIVERLLQNEFRELNVKYDAET